MDVLQTWQRLRKLRRPRPYQLSEGEHLKVAWWEKNNVLSLYVDVSFRRGGGLKLQSTGQRARMFRLKSTLTSCGGWLKLHLFHRLQCGGSPHESRISFFPLCRTSCTHYSCYLLWKKASPPHVYYFAILFPLLEFAGLTPLATSLPYSLSSPPQHVLIAIHAAPAVWNSKFFLFRIQTVAWIKHCLLPTL